jgi:hypothetical protein
MIRKTLLLSLAVLMVSSVMVFADGPKAIKTGKQADFEGTLVCLGCDLKQAEGARAACKAYGHKHALKTDDGKYVNFLENRYSEDLLKGEKYHNQKMKVSGVYYAGAKTLDVKSFQVDGKTKAWCGHCKAMDGCAAAGGMSK